MILMLAGCGISDLSGPVARARQAADMAMGEAGLVRAHTAVVFTQAESAAQYLEILAAVRQVTGAQELVGASAQGVITQEGEWEEGPSCAVMVLAPVSDALPPKSLILHQDRKFNAWPPEGFELYNNLLVMGDPGCFNLDAFNEVYQRGDWTIVGGGASGFVQGLPGAPVFFNEECHREASVGIAFPRELQLHWEILYGCHAVCVPMVVTKAKRNMILELSGKPAVRMLESTLSKIKMEEKKIEDEQKDREEGAWAILAGFMRRPPHGSWTAAAAGSAIPSPSDFTVRPIMAVDPVTGGIMVGEDLEEGAYLTFVIREKNWAHREFLRGLLRLRARLQGRRPAFGFYFNCSGRGSHLFGEPSHDVRMIRRHLGHFPLIGMSSSFELAPQGLSLAIHGFTGVLALYTS